MFGAIFKATYGSFQQGMTFCLSTYMKKVLKLLSFIFKHPSYTPKPNAKLKTCMIWILFGRVSTSEFQLKGQFYTA